MDSKILIIFLFLGLICENTLISFPLVFAVSLALFILYPKISSVLIGVLFGFALDSLRVSHFGITPLSLSLLFFFLSLYSSRFEIKDPIFIAVFLTITSFLYAEVSGYAPNIFFFMILGAEAFGIGFFVKRRTLIA